MERKIKKSQLKIIGFGIYGVPNIKMFYPKR